jgi:FkbM family methyltransferase
MINFNDVNRRETIFSPKRWLGKLLRAPLRLIPKDAALPILQGPGRGLRWIVGSYNHGCWLGSYEYEKQRILKRIVNRGDIVYDVGAHVGYFTIIFSKLVGPTGRVYSFEPFSDNARYIFKHVELNGLNNVTVIKAGIGEKNESAFFRRQDHTATVRMDASEGELCEVYNLVSYIESNALEEPSLIKMDIEGAEAIALPSIKEFLRKRRIKLLISTHSDRITDGVVELLNSLGYELTPLQWANLPVERKLTNATLLFGKR